MMIIIMPIVICTYGDLAVAKQCALFEGRGSFKFPVILYP